MVPAHADPMTRVSQSPANPLASPVWWLAVVTLLINDHVLKTAGVLPGILTGKLSDFAGLVVAPVLLVALLRVKSLRARIACFTVVGVGFSVVKLSGAAAIAAAGALTAIGIPSRIIADPTDLIALAVLPAAFLLTTPRPSTAIEMGPARTFFGRAGLVVGMIACMATSQTNQPMSSFWTTPAYLLNSTGAALDVRIRYYDGELDCEAIGDNAAHALAPSAFGEGVRFHLEAGQTVPLSQPDVLEATGEENEEVIPSPQCEIALIQSDAMPSTIVWWSNLSDVSVPTAVVPSELENRPDLLVGLVSLHLENGNLKATPRGLVKGDIAKATPGESTCPVQGKSFQWSHVTFADGDLTVVSVDNLPDGCTEVGLVYGDGMDPNADEHRISLCIPAGVFTFQPGETLSVSSTPGESRTLAFWSATKSVSLYSMSSGPEGELWPNATFNTVDCNGDRMECGGFSVPVTLLPTSGSVAIKPGQESTVDGPDGKKMRILLGRAEQVLAARDACEPGRQSLGMRADYIVVIE